MPFTIVSPSVTTLIIFPLRDLIVIIEAHRSKCYHLGFGKHVTKSNLAKANQNRDCRIFEKFAYFLVAEARSRRITDIFKLGGSVYAFDSTTIDLCLSVFWWPSSASIRAASRYTPSMTSRLRCLHSSTSPKQRSTTSVQWMSLHTSLAHQKPTAWLSV